MSISSTTSSSLHHHHQSKTSSEHSGRSSNRYTLENVQHRVMKSVTDYNRQLNQERKEDRRVCMDLQTYTIQYPVGLGRENKGLRKWSRKRARVSSLWRDRNGENGNFRYPIALLPNQYQDWFLRYNTHELNYLPLKTVLHGPVVPNIDKLQASSSTLLQMAKNPNDSDSEIEGSDVLSDLDDDSTCSCGEIHCAPSPPIKTFEEPINDRSTTIVSNFNNENILGTMSSTTSIQYQNEHNNLDNNSSSQINPSSSLKLCKMCKQDTTGSIIEPICCADCKAISHPSCLEISGELLEAIRLYRWQCQDCKSCQKCGQPHDEERMMFCDKCDRGYHTYCVGLVDIPQGHWVCSLCAICANCGTRNPNESLLPSSSSMTTTTPFTVSINQQQQQTLSSSSSSWQHELIKIHSPDGQTLVRHTVFCESCYQSKKLPTTN